jgi:osmotically-inducible protein OsmY
MRDAAGSVAISAKQASLNVPDPELAKRVETALDRAPYLDADHITVTSRVGIVTLQGMVGSASDLQDALKISSRVGGVKDVIDDLEIWEFGGRNM